MKKQWTICLTMFVVASFLMTGETFARGFGGARSGGRAGVSRGGASRSASRSSAAVRTPTRSGTRQTGSRTATGSRGGSVTVGGTRGAASGPRGSAAGRAGGVQVTTPGGRSVTKGGASGAVSTPRGGAAGSVQGGSASGPGGRTVSGGSARGAVSTPRGTAAGGVRGGSVSGARGSVSGVQGRAAGRSFAGDSGFARYSGGVSVRGRSGAAVGHRTHAVAHGTRHTHAVGVRRSVTTRHVGYHSWFGTSWYTRHPSCWRPARFVAGTVWTATAWSVFASTWGYTQPIYYDYGNTVVYEGDTVYYDDKQVATAGEYYEQAADIAEAGSVEVTEQEDWMALGVWAMIQGEETESNKILQLSVSKGQVIRGNYYDALTETTLPIEGSVDKTTQRAAWTIGDNKDVVYETGLNNLTGEETSMLVHFSKDSTQQWSLVRLEESESDSGK